MMIRSYIRSHKIGYIPAKCSPGLGPQVLVEDPLSRGLADGAR